MPLAFRSSSACALLLLLSPAACAPAEQPRPPAQKADAGHPPTALRPVDPGDASVPDDSLLPGPPTPFAPEVYKARRERLMQQLGRGVALVLGADDTEEGPQDPDFLYLTGLEDDQMALVLAPQARGEREYLFLKTRDPESEAWAGFRMPLGTELRKRTGFREVFRRGRLGGMLARLAARYPTLHFLGPVVPPDAPPPPELALYQDVAARIPGVSIAPAHELLPRMRSLHDDAEIALMRKASDVTGAALRQAMQKARPGMHEYDLKDVIENAFRAGGSRRPAFPSIVGSGPNAAVLHYRRDDRVMADGDLVVCDVGAEVGRYAADVTRTMPVSGRFTDGQKKLYEIVLRAQEAAIAQVRPGAVYREDIHRTAQRVIEEAGYLDYFIHGTSHFIGLEVHDAGIYEEPLQPGMVISVEPGIYLPGRRMGVRIEDMVLVTAGGAELLSGGIPRRIEEIEAEMAK